MSGQGPVVRRAKASDAAAIAALQVRSWRAAYRAIVPDAFLDGLAEDAWLERWTHQLAGGREGLHQLVSTDTRDGLPHAVAACGPAMEPTADLTGQLYVRYADPARWGGVTEAPCCAASTNSVLPTATAVHCSGWPQATIVRSGSTSIMGGPEMAKRSVRRRRAPPSMRSGWCGASLTELTTCQRDRPWQAVRDRRHCSAVCR